MTVATELSFKKPVVQEVSIVQRILWICNLVYYSVVSLISSVLLWIFFNEELSHLFTWHIICATAAYMPFMTVAIASFSEDNLLTQKIPRNRRYWIHGVMLMLSCALVTAGIWSEYHYKNTRGSRHFSSNHALTGICSWGFVVVSQFTGLLAAKPSLLPSFMKPVFVKFFHNLLGLAGFMVGIGSLYLMLGNRILRGSLSSDAIAAFKWLIWMVAAWTILPAFKTLFNQLKNIFS